MFRFFKDLGANKVTSSEEYIIKADINSINLQGNNGSIIWHPIDTNEQSKIVIEKVITGSLNEELEKYLDLIKLEDHSSNTKIILKAINPRKIRGIHSTGVYFTVYVSPGQIKEFEAKTSNGPLKIKADFEAILNLKTSNGTITLYSGTGKINASTSNGRIDLGKLNFTGSSSVVSSNGRIEGTVSFPSSGDFRFATSNGIIDLQMPNDTQGNFHLATSNGKINFRLGDDELIKQQKVAILRGEGPSIKIATSNGQINVRGVTSVALN